MLKMQKMLRMLRMLKELKMQKILLKKAKNVQMDDGPMDRLCYVNLDCPNGRRSNGPPMLRQFGPSKWTTVQWTVHVTSIWTVQMDDGPMDRLCYVNLDGPLDRLYYGNLDRPKLRLWTVILDCPKIRL